jgi:hypothetical protein
MSLNPHALYGEQLDSIVALALGWTLHKTEDPQHSYYITEEKPIQVAFWKPTDSSRQVIRLILRYKISIEYSETACIWSASAKLKNGDVTVAKAKKMHEAVCRCFVSMRIKNGDFTP